MPTEMKKVPAAELCDPVDPALVRARQRARALCRELNATREADQEARRHNLKELLGAGGEGGWPTDQPARCSRAKD
jgi:maltose O-acetyltransferase